MGQFPLDCRVQDLSDVNTESNAVDKTLQMACACSCIVQRDTMLRIGPKHIVRDSQGANGQKDSENRDDTSLGNLTRLPHIVPRPPPKTYTSVPAQPQPSGLEMGRQYWLAPCPEPEKMAAQEWRERALTQPGSVSLGRSCSQPA